VHLWVTNSTNREVNATINLECKDATANPYTSHHKKGLHLGNDNSSRRESEKERESLAEGK